MNTVSIALFDRVLAVHQSILQVRQVYEDAFTRVLVHREEYESAMRECEQAKRALRSAEIDYEALLTEIRQALLKGQSHGQERKVTEDASDRNAGGLEGQDGPQSGEPGQAGPPSQGKGTL